MIIKKKERIIVTAPFTVYHSQSLFLEADSGSVTASAYSLVLGSLTGLSLPRLPPLYKGHDASLGVGELWVLRTDRARIAQQHQEQVPAGTAQAGARQGFTFTDTARGSEGEGNTRQARCQPGSL